MKIDDFKKTFYRLKSDILKYSLFSGCICVIVFFYATFWLLINYKDQSLNDFILILIPLIFTYIIDSVFDYFSHDKPLYNNDINLKYIKLINSIFMIGIIVIYIYNTSLSKSLVTVFSEGYLKFIIIIIIILIILFFSFHLFYRSSEKDDQNKENPNSDAPSDDAK